MKKSLLILSMLALTATTARAYDTFEAGTDEAPNYYLIKANRGLPYLSYSPETLTNGSVQTQLHRTETVSEYSLWAVTPGSQTGTVVMKNYAAESYMMGYKTSDGSEFVGKTGATADVVSAPTDVFIYQYGDQGFEMSLLYNQGYGSIDGEWRYFGLDATGGTSQFCGNYFADGTGGKWWALKVDLSEGKDVNQAMLDVLAPYITAAKDAAVATLEHYLTNVPQAETEINAGITAIKAVNSLTYEADINKALSDAMTSANNGLAATLNGNTYVLKNLRREAVGRDNYYLAVIGTRFGASTDIADEQAWFEFEATDDSGVIIHNLAAGKYMSWELAEGETSISNNTKVLAVDSKADAKPFYPLLSHVENYYGIAFAFSSSRTGYNLDQDTKTDGGGLVSYGINNNGGGVFTLIDADPTEIVKEAITSSVAELTAYSQSLPAYASTFSEGISKLKALKYSSDLQQNISNIADETKGQVNNDMKTAFDGKIYAFNNLRRAAKEGNSAVSGTPSIEVSTSSYPAASLEVGPSTWFKFTSADNGGYTMQSVYNNTFVYVPATVTEGVVDYGNATPSTEESEKTPVYPVLCHSGNYYGISFPYSSENPGEGLNVNEEASGLLTSWDYADGGSIWTLVEHQESEVEQYLATLIASTSTALDSYAENVVCAKDIFTQAKADIANAQFIGKVVSINDDAIADANELLKTVFDGKDVTLKMLSNGKFISLSDSEYNFGEGDIAAVFAFKSTENGGYTIYNKNKNVYFYKNDVVVDFTENVEKATSYYPQLSATSVGNGVCLPSSSDYPTSNAGICYSSAWNPARLYDYQITGGNAPMGVFAIDIVGDTTEIAEVEASAHGVGAIYDLSGRRLSAPVRGINIINGKKVLVK